MQKIGKGNKRLNGCASTTHQLFKLELARLWYTNDILACVPMYLFCFLTFSAYVEWVRGLIALTEEHTGVEEKPIGQKENS